MVSVSTTGILGIGKARCIVDHPHCGKQVVDVLVDSVSVQPNSRGIGEASSYREWMEEAEGHVTISGRLVRPELFTLEQRLALAVLEGDKKTALLLADEVQEWNHSPEDFTPRKKLREKIAEQEREIGRLKTQLENVRLTLERERRSLYE